MSLLRNLVLMGIRSLPFRAARHRHFLRSKASTLGEAALADKKTRVLVLGVYLADRPNSAEHLNQRFASAEPLVVEQRWVAMNGAPSSPQLGEVTSLRVVRPEPKFALINKLLQPGDLADFDFIIACDDDIFLPANFLPVFIAYQQMFGFSIAQPARAWHSFFDHAFVLRRPGLLARETRFVESGPLVSFRRDAAQLLMPFDADSQMWGLDFVWPEVIGRHGLTMGISDGISVDHSLRPQATSYKKGEQDAAMYRYLAATPHLSMQEAFRVVKRYWAAPVLGNRPG